MLIEKYYPRLTLDFHTNKRICDEVAIIPSKRLRNKIAGFTTHLMKRIQKGPVRGISFKLQEEERERKDVSDDCLGHSLSFAEADVDLHFRTTSQKFPLWTPQPTHSRSTQTPRCVVANPPLSEHSQLIQFIHSGPPTSHRHGQPTSPSFRTSRRQHLSIQPTLRPRRRWPSQRLSKKTDFPAAFRSCLYFVVIWQHIIVSHWHKW